MTKIVNISWDREGDELPKTQFVPTRYCEFYLISIMLKHWILSCMTGSNICKTAKKWKEEIDKLNAEVDKRLEEMRINTEQSKVWRYKHE